ncbi:hypothetical protein O0L34_g4572 [Tuta absoluta]|nr:hypothetical protein O0L34_g4572 [Tuta absoluta]
MLNAQSILILGFYVLFKLLPPYAIGVPHSRKICIPISDTLRARHKTCFLRPDNGPCRADILQWYFDAKQNRCYRFFWGGCQGNGNRFATHEECVEHCFINATIAFEVKIPHYCNLAFDYGTCFGSYNRWGYDKFLTTCTRRIYSGCGGNQNNFQTIEECMSTCVHPPRNTFGMTTCVPVEKAFTPV